LYRSLGGSGPVIWSYFAEFQPKSKRGSMLSFMAAFWTLGNLFVAGKMGKEKKSLNVVSLFGRGNAPCPFDRPLSNVK
jgi:MFS family permease